MKNFVCVLALTVLVGAEPPRYRQSKYRFAREQIEESGGERELFKSDREAAPYPSSGHKPHKEFRLPSRMELAPPATSYGIPEESYRAPLYVAPLVEYGLPNSRSYQEKAGEEEDSESASVESEGESEEGDSDEEESEGKSERKEKGEKKDKEEKREKWEKKERSEKKRKGEKKENLDEGSDNDNVVSSRGAYYVLLPGSELQRVQFQTENDLSKMAYTARLQYRNEGRAPVYVYTAVPQYQAPAAYTSVIPSYPPSAAFSAYSVQQQW